MTSAEKIFETFNPLKAFEAASQGKMFDVKAQSKFFENAIDQSFELAGNYQAQARKAVELWMDQSEEVMQEGQKLVKSWMASVIKANADIATDVQATAKEAVKVFDLPKVAKKA